MNPVPFPEANRVFTKPPSMTDEECQSLHVHDTGAALVSCWQLTDEERAAIAAGAPLWLWVIGRGHPPVSLQVDTPFERPAPEAPRETPPDERRGLYRKYDVKRLHDPARKHADCGYYVLDLNHDRFAAPALRAYADACEAEYRDLARDLRVRADGVERMAGAASTGERGGDALRRKIESLIEWYGHQGHKDVRFYPSAIVSDLRAALDDAPPLTLLGMPVRADPALPTHGWKVVDRDGNVLASNLAAPPPASGERSPRAGTRIAWKESGVPGKRDGRCVCGSRWSYCQPREEKRIEAVHADQCTGAPPPRSSGTTASEGGER